MNARAWKSAVDRGFFEGSMRTRRDIVAEVSRGWESGGVAHLDG